MTRKIKILREAPEEQQAKPKGPVQQISFEEDPMNYIIAKYPSLKEMLTVLMTDAFKDYITGIYVVAPRPTTFKIVLHNNQEFILEWTGKTYICKVEGKKYYLSFISDKQRATKAIAQLLELGAPIGKPGPAKEEENAPKGPEEEEGSEPGEELGGGGEEEETLEESVKPLRRLKIRITEAASKAKASDFELALVVAWHDTFPKKNNPDALATEGGIPPKQAAAIRKDKQLYSGAINAITANKAMFRGKTAYKVPSTPTTSFWTQFGATDKTAKTDVVLGKVRASVKVGPAQLMSGGKEETQATLAAAINSVPELKNTPEFQEIQKIISKFTKGGYTDQDTVGNALKQGTDKKITAADKLHKLAMAKLTQLFTNNPELKTACVQEAMTGVYKFGPDSEACAEYVLSADTNFQNAKLHKITPAYSAKVAEQVKIVVRFKSTSEKLKSGKTGRYRYWTALSAMIDPTQLKEEDLESVEAPVDVALVGADTVNFDV